MSDYSRITGAGEIIGYVLNVYKIFENKHRRKYGYKDISYFLSKESLFA